MRACKDSITSCTGVYLLVVTKKQEAQQKQSALARNLLSDACSTFVVPISALLPADSPRLAGESAEHTRMLAESEAELPPIIVHRPSMRVIDGMHRLQAAVLRGSETIEVRFVEDGEGHDLFVLAVAANIRHGLPLTRADRQAAAERIVCSHPQWSDRAIARATGIATKTVSAIRARLADRIPETRGRIGRDGRLRPLDGTEGRILAGEILRADPDASIRRVAKEAGISVGTAFDVRRRIMSGEDPAPAALGGECEEPPAGSPVQEEAAAQDVSRGTSSSARRRAQGRRAAHEASDILKMLMKDPSLRYTDSGRVLLRRLSSLGIGILEWEDKVEAVPKHCAHAVADYARQVADSWMQFAEQLESSAPGA